MSDKIQSFSHASSLTDEIVDIIRQRILNGEYKIGEKIKENRIATELKVSRTPIREAFKQLESEGLIDYVPNKGCYAKGFTSQDIEDIYAVRKALELLAVEWAVGRISPTYIQQLKEKRDLMEFYTIRKDSQKVMELNTEFHDVLYHATGSRFMAQVLRSYKEYIEQTKKVIYYEKESLEEILEEHQAILDAILHEDVEAAKAAMATHLDGSQRRAKSLYQIAK